MKKILNGYKEMWGGYGVHIEDHKAEAVSNHEFFNIWYIQTWVLGDTWVGSASSGNLEDTTANVYIYWCTVVFEK